MGNCFERNFCSSENNFFSFLTFAKLLKNKFLLEIGGSKQMASHGFSGNLGRKEKEKKNNRLTRCQSATGNLRPPRNRVGEGRKNP